MPAQPMPEPADLKSAIRALAASLGFARVGFTGAEAVEHAPALQGWLQQGRHGTMDWLERTPEWRMDIRSRYGWARSFVMLLVPYAAELPERLPKGSALKHIARYARGEDYHERSRPALKALEDGILALGGPGTRALWYQDTGPFLERPLAARAGLGWVGKNTMLIDPATGSFSLLALVLTSLPLEPDTPGVDHCGTCTRCLEACPTQAFPKAFELDARRCISYLTIEHAGAIDPALRPGMGSWVFGCDICNEVCPWNSKAPRGQAEPGEELAGLTLARLLAARPEHLAKRIAGTPLERAGEARLRRNAAIVAGNLRDDALLPSLEQSGAHEDATVREAVYWALLRYGTPGAKAALARAQRHEVDDSLREMVISALQSWRA
ncbi:MAG: tRNA epoxyqueuosine(34) reductase QueG [Planctomycetes bacterium]|nr:tRNA epoxyqueuosine(34) reductase QueG [Planctomycetota bacterium]